MPPRRGPDDVPVVIAEICRSGTRFATSLDGLDDTAVRAPSGLPGWTRGHVASHVARSADSYGRLLALARSGKEPGPRADAGALARAVEEGARRPAAALAADVRNSLGGLTDDAASLPPGAWEALVTAVAGWRHPAWYTLYRCWRELETHHVDLNAGYRPADWPVPYVSWALDDTLAALTAREFPVARVEASDLGRAWTPSPAGPVVRDRGHTLLGWLSGRSAAPPSAVGHPVPDPPNWPMPPSPGWG